MPRVKYIYRKKAKKIRVYNVWKGMFTDMKSVIISLALAVVVLVISITYTKTLSQYGFFADAAKYIGKY